MTKPMLIVRADANSAIGSGHLMRVLALTHAWKDAGGDVVVVTACQETKVLQRFFDEKILVHTIEATYPHRNDLQSVLQVGRFYPRAWVALDGYHFDGEYHHALKSAGHPLLVIDDMGHLPEYHADILLNQNPSAASIPYKRHLETTYCLGTEHALLRREFLLAQRTRSFSVLSQRVLITTGGSDADNLSGKILAALNTLKQDTIEILVVVGALSPHLASLREAAKKSPHRVQVLAAIKNMPQIMAETDLAIAGAGTTSLELAYMGLPGILLTLYDNQRAIADAWSNSQAFVALGEPATIEWKSLAGQTLRLLADANERRKVSERLQRAVPGNGAKNVVRMMWERLASQAA